MYKAQLKTFLAVCDAGSFSKAAAALFITPSAVIQQINALESDLGVSLFNRSRHGLKLTGAGEYLELHGREYVHMGDELRKSLTSLTSDSSVIGVGTSVLEKCRLLYNLWVLFAEQESSYEIKMVNIESGHRVPESAELVESVNGEVEWTRDWNFLEICQVPFGIAVRQDHPLAKHPLIRLSELRGETVLSLNTGSSAQINRMLEGLRANGTSVVFQEGSGTSMLWECAFRQIPLVAPQCWSDILINMVMLPCDWSYTIPYGIFYRDRLSPPARRFLDFIISTYAEGNPQGIVPVL